MLFTFSTEYLPNAKQILFVLPDQRRVQNSGSYQVQAERTRPVNLWRSGKGSI